MFRLGSEAGFNFGGTWNAVVGERKRVITIDADGRAVTVITGSPFPDVEDLWELSGPLLRTIKFAER